MTQSPASEETELRVEIGDSFLGLFDGRVTDQFILIESKRGTGKTRAILTLFMTRAMAHPNSRWLVVRSSRTRLTDSAIATFCDQVLPLFGLPVPKCDRSNIRTYKLPNNAEFIFQAMDDPERQQSVECAGVYVVEGVEIPRLETITALAGAMRQACDPPILIYQCVVDCNPGSPSHPLNKIAEPVTDDLRMVNNREDYLRLVDHNQRPSSDPKKWKRIVAQHYDNPGYFSVVDWAWTELGKVYLKTLEWLTGTFKKRWFWGWWAAAEGVVFPEFDDSIHVVPNFSDPAGWPWYVGYDPGFAHVTAVPWLVVSPSGDVIVKDEIYEGGKSVEQHAETIKGKVLGRTVRRWYGDPHEFFSNRAQGKSCAVQAKDAGLPSFTPWANQNKQAMANSLRQMLINTATYKTTGRRVGPCLYVTENCVNTIMEFQTWEFKKTPQGGLPPGDDAFVDEFNHIMDCLVGMVSTGGIKWLQGPTIHASGGESAEPNGRPPRPERRHKVEIVG